MIGRVQTFCAYLILLLTPVAALGQSNEWGSEAFHVTLSPEQKKHILDGEFTIITTIASLPESVRAQLTHMFSQTHLDMADPDERFQETDVIAPGRHRPWRRLVFAGVSTDRCFVHYERGGPGHSYYVIVFRISEAGASKIAKPIWAGAGGNRRARDLQQLRAAISADLFSDYESYYR